MGMWSELRKKEMSRESSKGIF